MKKSGLIQLILCACMILFSGCTANTSNSTPQSVNLAEGTWELVVDKYNFQHIVLERALSLPLFEGKSKEEWVAYAESIGKVDNLALVWATDASLSPDGDMAVYLSNKDCIDTGGMSVFVFDLNTGEEHILLKSENRMYYDIHYWLDNRTLLCSATIYDDRNTKTAYLVCDLDGNVTSVPLQGDYPHLYAARDRFLAYQPDGDNSPTIFFGYFDEKNQWIETNRLDTTGGYPINGGAISRDGTLLAFPLRNPDPFDAARTMTLWEIASGTLIPLPDPVITDMENPAASWPRQKGHFLEVIYGGTGPDGNSREQLWRYVLPGLE